jgi:hypothetical protein
VRFLLYFTNAIESSMTISRYAAIRSKCVLVALFALAACASTTHTGYLKKMNSWVGHSETELVSQLGNPKDIHLSENGDKILSFEKSSFSAMKGSVTPAYTVFSGSTNRGLNPDFVIPASTQYQSSSNLGVTVSWYCYTMFTLHSGKVSSVEWSGNSCTANEK